MEFKKFVPSLETSLTPLEIQGKQTLSPGCPRNFARMSRTPGGIRKGCATRTFVFIFGPHMIARCQLCIQRPRRYHPPSKNTVGLLCPEASGKHRHEQIWGIVPGLGGWQKYVYAFMGSFLTGEKETHKQNPQKIPGQSRENIAYPPLKKITYKTKNPEELFSG